MTQATALKVKREKAFPGRYDWQCSTCKGWSRYFEQTCYACEYEQDHRSYRITLLKG